MFLDKINKIKQEEVKVRQQTISLQGLQEMIAARTDAKRDFRTTLRGSEIKLIAELKKASPSGGLIRKDFDPEEITKIYQQAGASAISILTDEKFFQGKLEYLQQVRAVVELPILRKDFLIDAYQIYEAKAFGADAILLIAALLPQEELQELLALARQIELDVLLEVHDYFDLEKALLVDAEIIGINNRNLQTMQISLTTFGMLSRNVPPEKILVAESGINTRVDVQLLQSKGADAILVGTSLMKAENIKGKINELLGHEN